MPTTQSCPTPPPAVVRKDGVLYFEGTIKQFDSAGEIQIWSYVCFWIFFLQFLCHMPLINKQMLSIFFVALSHCDKQKFCLLH